MAIANLSTRRPRLEERGNTPGSEGTRQVINFAHRQPRMTETPTQELDVHLRTMISDAGEDVAPGVAASMTTLLL